MLFRSCARCAILALLASPLAFVAEPACAAGPKTDSPKVEVVDLFEAMDADTIEAKLIPRDSKKLTLIVTNKSDKPLSVKLPTAFVGKPIVAQLFGGRGGGGGGGLFGNNNAPQAVGGPGLNRGGGPFGADGGPFALGGPGGGGGAGPFAPGIFNVPAETTIKAKLPCVCLQHGKPNPSPRIPYELVPVETFTESKEVVEVLEQLGRGKCSQRIAQLAAWHFTDGLTWEQLDALRIKHANGRMERQFATTEVEAAKSLVEGLPSSKAKPKNDSLSQR